MATYTSPLKHVRVAAPCPANWERMTGDNKIRFCDQCNLNVYNLSGMTRREAETLIANKEGRLCVRFYRRADGTILTGSCPVGLRAIKRRVSCIANAALSAAVGFLSGFGFNLILASDRNPSSPYQTIGTIAVHQESRAPRTIKEVAPRAVAVELGVVSQRLDGEWEKGRTSSVPKSVEKMQR